MIKFSELGEPFGPGTYSVVGPAPEGVVDPDDPESLLPLDDELDDLLEEDEPVEEEEEDNVFKELESILTEAAKAKQEDRALAAMRKRLAKVMFSQRYDAHEEREQLLADIRRLEDGRIWNTVASVALFKTQSCLSCHTTHSIFSGWFAEQKHISDPNARRLLAGKPREQFPERREDHREMVEVCTDCIETRIALDVAQGVAEGE